MAEPPPAEASIGVAPSDSAAGSHETQAAISRPHRSAGQRGILAVGVVAIIGCLAAVLFIAYEANKLDRIERVNVELAAAGDNEPQNWLIVGSDSRDAIAKNDPNSAVFLGAGDSGGQRSDTIMIVRIDPGATHLDVLSLQRDLWLQIAGTGGKERINSAYTFPDGPQRLVRTIHDDLGIDINHYAEINFAGFQGIVDAVGGVPMYFDKPLLDDNSGLAIMKPGCVTLNGQQALAFARSRHLTYSDGLHWRDDPSGDLGRISRQQYFMRRMFDAAASEAFSSPLTLNSLIDVGVQHVKLDEKLDTSKAVAMAQRFGQFKGDSIRTYSLPTSPYSTPGGASVLLLDEEAAKPILNRFRGLSDKSDAPENITLTIENGNGDTNQASEAGKAFQGLGYKVTSVTNRLDVVERTQVRYAPGSLKVADQVARHLTNGADLVRDESYSTGRVMLVSGRDFTTVMRRPYEVDPAVIDRPDPIPSSTTTAPAKTSTTAKGSPTTKAGTKKPGASSTTSTTAPLAGNNDGSPTVGVVPGQPPAGVTCE